MSITTQFPLGWYWLASDGRVYSAAAQNIVTTADAGYTEFLASGSGPTPWPRDNSGAQTDEALLEVIGAYGLSISAAAALVAYAASARFAKETGGITISGSPVQTDRSSQAQLTGAYAYVQVVPAAVIQWKQADGSFVSLNATAIAAVATAVAAHVQACFAEEATLVAAINAVPPTVTSKAQIDAAFAAITA